MKSSTPMLGMLSLLSRYFGTGRSQRSREQHPYRPSNHRMLKEVQEQIIAKAQAKRERKMARPQGWYNG